MLRYFCVAPIASLLLFGCGEQCSGSATRKVIDETTQFDVEWAPEVKVIPASEMEHGLVRDDVDEAGVFRFNADAEQVQGLKEGDIAVLDGLAFGRVASATSTSEGTTLKLDFVPLTEAIVNGEIGWTRSVLSHGHEHAELGEGFGEVTEALSEPVEASGTVAGRDVSFSLTPAGDRFNVDLTITQGVATGEAKFVVKASGWIEDFQSKAQINIHDRTLTEYAQFFQGLKGELTGVAIGVGTENIEQKLEVPVSIKFPFQVGPIPIELELSARAYIVSEVAGTGTSAQVELKYVFDADHGFRVVTADPTLTPKLENSVRGSSLAPANADAGAFGSYGFGGGVEFPRVQVSVYPEVAKLAGSEAMAYFSFETYQYALFSFAEPCKEAGAALTAKAGYDLKLLGLKVAESEKDLWKKTWQSPDGGCLGK